MIDRLNFPVDQLKTCWFASIRQLGFRTSVSVRCPSDHRLLEGSFKLRLDLFDSSGEVFEKGIELGELHPAERRVVDVEDFAPGNREYVGHLQMVPDWLPEEHHEVSPSELREWTALTDEFVGYRSATGLQSGVHYQSPPMNDIRISSSNTVIVQSPKVVINAHTDSYFMAYVPSSNADFCGHVTTQIAILGSRGEIFARSTEEIPARGRRLISISDTLERAGTLKEFMLQGGSGMMIALCTGGVIAPLSLLAHVKGGLAVDHTLPPPYYVPWWGGEIRRKSAATLVESIFGQQ